MQSSNYAYINGQFVPEAAAAVSIFDRGFLYGDGVFETMRVYGGKIFRLDSHLKRLLAGLQRLVIPSPSSAEEFRALVSELIKRNGVTNGMARVYVTRGEGTIELAVNKAARPTVIALAQSRDFAGTPKELRTIVSSITLREHSPLEGIKSANRLEYILARAEAQQQGADDAVLLTEDGWVMEFTASNLFVVMAGKVSTPSVGEGPLLGITRGVVLEIATELGIQVEEAGFDVDVLAAADEIFATNSLIEIASVAEFNGRSLPSRAVASRLREAYRALVCKELGL